MVFLSEVLFCIYPLFGYTAIESGGLGLSEAEIGVHMSIRAIIHIGAIVFFPALQKRLGVVRLYQWVMMLFPVTVAFFPISSFIAMQYGSAQNWAVWLSITTLFGVWAFTGFTWPCMSMMIVNAAPGQESMSRINGLLQMCIVVAQAVAPASGTSLFAFSVKNNICDGQLIWIVLFLIACSSALHSLTLHDSNQGDDMLERDN